MFNFMKADFSPNGVLRIYASSNAEAYALKAWESARKSGRAKIEVYENDQDWLPGAQELMELIGKDKKKYAEFLAFKGENPQEPALVRLAIG